MGLPRIKVVGVGIGLLGAVLVSACGGGTGSSGSGGLAANQVLHFPTFQDPQNLDPGESDQETDSELAQNVFDNLFRYDDKLNLVPDLATSVPTAGNGISSDNKTYTFHLRTDATFADGTPVTANDVAYSWNRAAALRGPYSSNLGAIAGYSDVRTAGKQYCAKNADVNACHSQVEQHLASKDPALQMSGLKVVDDHTLQVTLAQPAGWFMYAISLQDTTGAVVEEKNVQKDPANWWTHPCTGGNFNQAQGCLFGTGAYYLDSYTPKQSIDFKQVPHWYGSPKPTLTEIAIDIKPGSDGTTQVAAWEQGTYDLVGYGGNSALPIADILRIQKNGSEQSQLKLIPKGRTTWLSFNIGYPATGGPFVGESEAAIGLRKAFTLAVDKSKLAEQVCHNLTCAPANGGLITKGLTGYLGDNADPLGGFDPTTAKSLLKQYDPDGSKTANLTYTFNPSSVNNAVATFLQGQWQDNLGVHVNTVPGDPKTFIADRLSGKFVMARDGWQFDYNHPQDWYDNLWGTIACGGNTSGYADNGSCGDGATDSNPTYDDTLTKADGLPLDQALPLYTQLAKLMQRQVAYLPLYYSVGQFLIHSYVNGAGSNAQADFYWDEISISSH